MPGLVIKNLPPALHRKLKKQAARNHRSMTKQVLAILERILSEDREAKEEAPPPLKGRFSLTRKFIDKAKREGRA